jgi:hypothetical protein
MSPKSSLVVACLLLLLAFAIHANAVSNFCPSGTCDIAKPIYINVYWDTSAQQWNTDIAGNDPTATISRVDALTDAICHSAYFSQLTQYSVTSCKMLPSFVENGCGAVPADLDKAHDKLGDFATCVISHHPDFDQDRTILNVMLPPQVVPATPTSVFCSQFSGEHDKYGSPVAVTFIPTNSMCNPGIKGISAVMTHEMVEATTDPVPQSPTGWKVIADGEVADQCEDKTPSSTSFLFGRVSFYFSDSANACTNGISSAIPFTPVITTATVCGSGQQMKITIDGDLGTKPWDLMSSGTGGSQTMFLQAAMSGSHTWSAGGIANSPPDMVGFGPVSWTHSQNMDKVVISGFDNRYGISTPGSSAVVDPGDTIAVKLSSWLSGQSISANLTVPVPDRIKNFRVTPDVRSTLPIYLGDEPTVNGKLLDTGDCAEQGSELTPKSDFASDVFYPIKSPTLSDGSFSFKYTPGAPAGTHHVSFSTPVSATLPVPVHPIADELSNTIGGVAGGQIIRLSGKGFASGGTNVSFSGSSASANAANIFVPDGDAVQLSTPPSPLKGQGAGVVDVVATVNGQDSIALSYRYVVPLRPVLTFISSTCPFAGDQSINSLEVNAYNADGSAANETIALSTAYPAFDNGTGQLVSTLTASPGQTVSMKSVGPVTATPSADPTLAITRKYKEGPLEKGCNPGSMRQYVVVDYIRGPGPVENTLIAALVSQDGRGLAWVAPAVAEQISVGTLKAPARPTGGDYILLMGKGKTSPDARSAKVQRLGLRDLKSLMRENPFALGSIDKESRKVRFLGPNFDIRSGAREAANNIVFRTPAMMLFNIASGQDTGQYRIMHLLPRGTTWTESKATAVHENARNTLRASITEAGTYALARVER